MTKGKCYLLWQNVTSKMGKVTPEVTPQTPFCIYTIRGFYMFCYLVTSKSWVYTEKCFQAYTCARVRVRVYICAPPFLEVTR